MSSSISAALIAKCKALLEGLIKDVPVATSNDEERVTWGKKWCSLLVRGYISFCPFFSYLLFFLGEVPRGCWLCPGRRGRTIRGEGASSLCGHIQRGMADVGSGFGSQH